jgi:nucleotide-binding universal stress UspA family protein
MECKITNLLVGFDFTENGHRAVASAVALARKTGAEVRILSALTSRVDPALIKFIEATKGTHPDKLIDRAQLLERAEAKVKEAIQDIDTSGVKLSCEAEYRSYPKAILADADIYNPDIIVVGATSPGHEASKILGTSTERLARKSRWPVLVTRLAPVTDAKRILCPVDFSSASERALGWALELATFSGAEVEVLTVLDGFEGLEVFLDAGLDITEYRQEQYRIAREQLDGLLQRFSADARGVKVSANVLEGVPHQVIIEHALRSGADLISIGSLGRSGVMEVLIGGTSERVLRALPCSVLMVKPDEFVFEYKGKVYP